MAKNTNKPNKKAFLLYYDYFEIISELSDEQAGKLLKAIYEFLVLETELKSDDGMLRIVWKQIKNNLNRDMEKYEKVIKEQEDKSKMGGIIRALKDGNRISDKSIEFLSKSNIGKKYLERQGVQNEVIEELWKRIEKCEQKKNNSF